MEKQNSPGCGVDLTVLPPEMRALSHQVAGHMPEKSKSIRDVFLECSDATILKPIQNPPRGERELKFYEGVFDANCHDCTLLKLRSFLPRYLGTFTTPLVPGVEYLKLEDIAARFHRPCILDIKMGPITSDPEATAEKIAQEKAKYPPVEKVGFQLRGMRVYKCRKQDFELHGKEFLRSLNEEEVLTKGFPSFFNQEEGLRTDVVKAILPLLKNIQDWFESQRQLSFYASSLLLVYEGDPSSASHKLTPHRTKITDSVSHPQPNSGSSGRTNIPDPQDTNTNTADDLVCEVKACPSAGTRPALVDVRMIDFAHVFPTKEKDENYLIGLRSLISYFNRLLQT